MLRLLGTRLAAVIPTLLFATFTIFGLQHIGPADPATLVLGENATEERIAEVPTAGTVAVICRTANRSASGISILRRAGRDNVVHVLGGMSQWGSATGGCAPTACATTPTAVGSNSKGGTR